MGWRSRAGAASWLGCATTPVGVKCASCSSTTSVTSLSITNIPLPVLDALLPGQNEGSNEIERRAEA